MMGPCTADTPIRRTRSKSMSRRIRKDVKSGKPAIKQRGYVYQKGRKKDEPWSPAQATYGRYRTDLPGEHRQREVRVALGHCRDDMEAMLKLHEKMEEAGVLSVESVRERIGPNSTFRNQGAWWLDELRTGRPDFLLTMLPVLNSSSHHAP